MPILAVALVELVAALVPWLVAWFLLGGNVDKVTQNIEKIGEAITKGPVTTATNAWVKVAFIGAGLGIGIWLLETKIAKAENLGEVKPPTVAPIQVAQAPSFGGGGGFSIGRGGPSLDQKSTVGFGGRGRRKAPVAR